MVNVRREEKSRDKNRFWLSMRIILNEAETNTLFVSFASCLFAHSTLLCGCMEILLNISIPSRQPSVNLCVALDTQTMISKYGRTLSGIRWHCGKKWKLDSTARCQCQCVNNRLWLRFIWVDVYANSVDFGLSFAKANWANEIDGCEYCRCIHMERPHRAPSVCDNDKVKSFWNFGWFDNKVWNVFVHKQPTSNIDRCTSQRHRGAQRERVC